MVSEDPDVAQLMGNDGAELFLAQLTEERAFESQQKTSVRIRLSLHRDHQRVACDD